MSAETLEQLRECGRRAERIISALDALDRSRYRLSLVNEHVTAGQVWTPKYLLKAGSYGREITVELPVPGRYLQQWAVDDVRAAERHVVTAGGAVPPDPYRKKSR